MGMETRRKPRISVNINIDCNVLEDSEQNFSLSSGKDFILNAVDINVLGVGATSKYYLPQGLIIIMKIGGEYFSMDTFIEVKSEIRYCRCAGPSLYRCGITFMDVPQQCHDAINRFVTIHEKDVV